MGSHMVRVERLPRGRPPRAFADLAWEINAGDPAWVPPLRMSLMTALDPRRHPFHRHAEVALFLARRGERVVGRVAAIDNRLHNEYHGERTGFFGLFECEESQETASALLQAAAEWLKGRGLGRLRGPVNLSTNEEIASPGVLIEGFDTPQVAMMSHNPPYYATLLAGAGLEKAKDLYAYWLDDPTPPARLARGIERILDHSGATIRPLELGRFREEVDIIKDIYNAAWSKNWGFVPLTDAEFDHLAKEFRPIVDPDLCLIAEKDGEAIGFSLTLPDINQALRHLPDGRLFPFGLLKFLWYRRRITGLRAITLGFKPGYQHLGLGAAFYLRSWQVGAARGYDRAEASWILEDNLDMVRPLERMGGRVHRVYRIFEREI